MADNTVTTKFVADPRDEVVLQLLKQQKEITNVQKKLVSLSQSSKRGSSEAAAGHKSQAAGLATLAKAAGVATIAYGVLRNSIGAVIQQNIDYSRSLDTVSKSTNEFELKLRIQGGLTPVQLQKKLPKIAKNLLTTPSTDVTGALQLETQLASSGFSKEDIASGKGLQTVLDLRAATNQFGREPGDVREGVKAISQFLKAQGHASPTATQIRETGGRLTQLFEGSDIQFSDLTALAGDASALQEKGVSENVQLAAFSALVDVKGGPEAATGLRQVVSRLRSASKSTGKTAALKRLGLKPEDVDLIGEDLPTALETLKAGLKSTDERSGSLALTTIFGEKGESAAGALLTQTGTIRDRIKALDGNAFERNLQVFQQSDFARNARLEIRQQLANRVANLKGGDITYANVRAAGEARQAELLLQADTPQQRREINAQAAVRGMRLKVRESLGRGPLDETGLTPQQFNEGAEQANKRAVIIIDQEVKEILRKNNRLLEDNLKKPQRVEVMNEPRLRNAPAAAANGR